ncbi:hypothetical protein, partial [Bacillus altitudinis]
VNLSENKQNDHLCHHQKGSILCQLLMRKWRSFSHQVYSLFI